jgi:hypothetical protein
MLNFTPATAVATTAMTADANALQAATRPLAGFGAGAFTCEGAWVGSQGNETVAALALPRIESAVDGISVRSAQAAALGATWLTSEVAKPDGAHAGGAGSDGAFSGTASAGSTQATTVKATTVKATTVQAASAKAATVHVSIGQTDSYNFIQMTRLYPVIPGGVGPHPAREPVPV